MYINNTNGRLNLTPNLSFKSGEKFDLPPEVLVAISETINIYLASGALVFEVTPEVKAEVKKEEIKVEAKKVEVKSTIKEPTIAEK